MNIKVNTNDFARVKELLKEYEVRKLKRYMPAKETLKKREIRKNLILEYLTNCVANHSIQSAYSYIKRAKKYSNSRKTFVRDLDKLIYEKKLKVTVLQNHEKSGRTSMIEVCK